MFSSTLKKNQRKLRDTISRMRTTNSAVSRSQPTGSLPCWESSRTAGRGCHSDASVVSTVMMSSTPRWMPPPKSPVLKRGVMAFAMMIFDSASVSVPSRP